MKTFVVTGANRGIGLGLVGEALRFGNRVIAACRHPDAARELWEMERDYHDRIVLKALDVGDPASVAAFAKELSGIDKIDVLINNAGVSGSNARLAALTASDMEKVFRVNVVGPTLVSQALMPWLAKAQKPVVAHISSLMGSLEDNTSGGMYAYRMSKAALNMFNRCLSIEFPKVICVALHPGWVQTDMGGEKAPVSVEESTKGLHQVIVRLQAENTGRFYNYKGEELPW